MSEQSLKAYLEALGGTYLGNEPERWECVLILNAIVRHGWEYIEAATNVRGGFTQYFFKRPIQDQGDATA